MAIIFQLLIQNTSATTTTMKAKASVLTFICGAILINAVLNKIGAMICCVFFVVFLFLKSMCDVTYVFL